MTLAAIALWFLEDSALGPPWLPAKEREMEPPVEIGFLTRPGCSNSPLLHARLLGAIEDLAIDATPSMVDVSALPASDTRTGYGTPTILVDGKDLFGRPEPAAAPPT